MESTEPKEDDRVPMIVRRLKACSGRYPEIAAATGLGIDWLRGMAQGKFIDPGYSRVSKLEEWLDANNVIAA